MKKETESQTLGVESHRQDYQSVETNLKYKKQDFFYKKRNR